MTVYVEIPAKYNDIIREKYGSLKKYISGIMNNADAYYYIEECDASEWFYDEPLPPNSIVFLSEKDALWFKVRNEYY